MGYKTNNVERNQAEKIGFRTAVQEDIQWIMEIEREAFHENIVEDQEVFEKRIEVFSEGFLLMESEENIVGYLCGEIWDYQETPKKEAFTLGHKIESVHNKKGGELYIASMGLRKSTRGLGFGKRLFHSYLNKMIETFPNLHSVILIVCEDWQGARNIYKGAGFYEMFEIQDFFRFGKGIESKKGIVMRKNLSFDK